MANIRVLDQNTINQIAAGEVIERPASVVKELLENAIDARATAVTIEIKEGGIGLIRVTDNGCGIQREEIPTAFLRHATSKIRTVEDLFTVASLGFRGEALSSIASVAQVELITKTEDSMSGTRYCIDGGEEKSIEEVGAPEGTTFLVRNLFYNTPARRKFLKTPATEGAHIADLVEKISLSHPEVSIRFIQNGQSRLHTSGNHSLRDIIYTIYGREIASNILPVDMGEDPVRVTGFIGKPLIARGNRNFENYFINGRYIKSSLINKAIEDAYKPFMMQHKYPFTMLHFAIESSFLDVNVHPAKMELRFRDGEMIYKMVYHTVSMALAGRELIPEVGIGSERTERGENRSQELSGKTGSGPAGYGENRPALKPVRFDRPEPFERKRKALLSPEIPIEREALRQDSQPDKNPGTESGGPAREDVPQKDMEKNTEKNMERDTEKARPLLGSGLIRENTSAYGSHLSEAGKGPGMGMIHAPAKEQESLGVRSPGASDEDESGRAARVQSAKAKGQQDGQDGGGNPEVSGQPEQLSLFEPKLLSREAREEHRIIGQLFDTYWLVEYRDSLYIIDQHAAHEKVLYEKTVASLKSREYTSQMINPPIILTLNSSEKLLLEKYMEHFTGIGFEIEPFGGREYAVRAVPANLFSIAKKELLMEMIDGLSDEMDRGNSDLLNEKIASMSCKAAVKGNHRLSEAEARALIDELLELENPYACPHGRPTIISMSRYELEKKFKRIV